MCQIDLFAPLNIFYVNSQTNTFQSDKNVHSSQNVQIEMRKEEPQN